MTEEEWLTATDPYAPLKTFECLASDRKFWLYAVACLNRQLQIDPTREDSKNLIAFCERAAAGHPEPYFDKAFGAVQMTNTVILVQTGEEIKRREGRLQVCLIHDIFGNPFRPVVADPAWFTPTAVAIASAIYQDRAFDRLPILADALEEAGCTSADVLLHCRQPGEHVRGCWVVDLVLGKE